MTKIILGATQEMEEALLNFEKHEQGDEYVEFKQGVTDFLETGAYLLIEFDLITYANDIARIIEIEKYEWEDEVMGSGYPLDILVMADQYFHENDIPAIWELIRDMGVEADFEYYIMKRLGELL